MLPSSLLSSPMSDYTVGKLNIIRFQIGSLESNILYSKLSFKNTKIEVILQCFDFRLDIVMESDMFVDSLTFFLRSQPLPDVLYPMSPRAVEATEKMIKMVSMVFCI